MINFNCVVSPRRRRFGERLDKGESRSGNHNRTIGHLSQVVHLYDSRLAWFSGWYSKPIYRIYYRRDSDQHFPKSAHAVAAWQKPFFRYRTREKPNPVQSQKNPKKFHIGKYFSLQKETLQTVWWNWCPDFKAHLRLSQFSCKYSIEYFNDSNCSTIIVLGAALRFMLLYSDVGKEKHKTHDLKMIKTFTETVLPPPF